MGQSAIIIVVVFLAVGIAVVGSALAGLIVIVLLHACRASWRVAFRAGWAVFTIVLTAGMGLLGVVADVLG